MVAAMQPPVGVPANGGPATLALVTLPEGEKVTTTVALPEGSPPRRQELALAAAAFKAATADCRLNGVPVAPAGLLATATGLGLGCSLSLGGGGAEPVCGLPAAGFPVPLTGPDGLALDGARDAFASSSSLSAGGR